MHRRQNILKRSMGNVIKLRIFASRLSFCMHLHITEMCVCVCFLALDLGTESQFKISLLLLPHWMLSLNSFLMLYSLEKNGMRRSEEKIYSADSEETQSNSPFWHGAHFFSLTKKSIQYITTHNKMTHTLNHLKWPKSVIKLKSYDLLPCSLTNGRRSSIKKRYSCRTLDSYDLCTCCRYLGAW